MVCDPRIPLWGIYSTSTYLCLCEVTHTQGLETIQMPIIADCLVKHVYIHVMEYQALTKKKTLTSKLSGDVRRLKRTVNTSTWYGQDVTLWVKMRGKMKTLHLYLFVYA